MGISGFDPLNPRVHLEVLRERLKNTEERVRQQEKDLAQVYTNLGRKETELIRIRDERDDLKIKWEVVKRDLKHTQELLLLSNQKTTKKTTRAKLLAFFASLIFLISSILANIGTGILTSTPPNSLGRVMIAVAIILYIVAALMTTLLAFEGGN
jgi:hypothetical protein